MPYVHEKTVNKAETHGHCIAGRKSLSRTRQHSSAKLLRAASRCGVDNEARPLIIMQQELTYHGVKLWGLVFGKWVPRELLLSQVLCC